MGGCPFFRRFLWLLFVVVAAPSEAIASPLWSGA